MSIVGGPFGNRDPGRDGGKESWGVESKEVWLRSGSSQTRARKPAEIELVLVSHGAPLLKAVYCVGAGPFYCCAPNRITIRSRGRGQ